MTIQNKSSELVAISNVLSSEELLSRNLEVNFVIEEIKSDISPKRMNKKCTMLPPKCEML